MENAAKAAVQTLIREYEHAQKCEQIVRDIWCHLKGENSEEREEAKDAVRGVIAALPLGASARQFEQARETALQPIRTRIAERLDGEMRQEVIKSIDHWGVWPLGISEKLTSAAAVELREAVDALPQSTPKAQLLQERARIVVPYRKAHERHQQKERLIDDGLNEIYRYIQRSEKDYEFDKGAYSMEQEIREPIRKALWEEVTGKETADHVAGIVRRLVREELEINE